MVNQMRQAPDADRRQFGRRSSLWHAWIVTGTKQRIACCLQNVSPGGALIEPVTKTILPPKFDLVVEGQNLSIRCEVRHIGEHGIGISFLDADKGRLLYDLNSKATPRPITEPVKVEVAPAKVELAPTPSHRPRLSPELIAQALRRPT